MLLLTKLQSNKPYFDKDVKNIKRKMNSWRYKYNLDILGYLYIDIETAKSNSYRQ
jgi:hypothetical protein